MTSEHANGNGKNGRGWVLPTVKTVTATAVLYVVVAHVGPSMVDNLVRRFQAIATEHNEILKDTSRSLAEDRKELVEHIVKALDRTNVVIENNSAQLGVNSAKLESCTRALWRVERMGAVHDNGRTP